MDNQYPSDPNHPRGEYQNPDSMQQPGMETSGPSDPGAGLPPDDGDIKISNTGQRVAAIAVVALIIAGVIGVIFYLQGKQEEIQKIKDVKAAFQKAHNAGYVEFWKKAQVDVKEMKSTAEFESRMRTVTADPVRYATHVKEACIPILDKSLPEYKAIMAPSDLEPQLKAVTAGVEELRGAWDAFASEYAKMADYFSAVEKLETASSHWLGWQQKPGTEKWLLNAVRYHKMMKCIFKGQKISDLDYASMESEVTNTCAKGDEKADWFRRFAFECVDYLKSGAPSPDPDFSADVEKAKEQMDTTSKLGIDTCIKRTKQEFESDEIQKLAAPWLTYIKAQNALLDAIDAKLKSLE